MIYPPNLLITNFCNQNCSFCFASAEMQNTSFAKKMSVHDYNSVLNKLSSNDVPTIKLLGGEPTLHPDFIKLISTALKKFHRVQIFTNGLMSKSMIEKLKKFENRVQYTFNILTPGFKNHKTVREQIIYNIIKLNELSANTISFTVDPFTSHYTINKLITKDIFNKLHSVRIGLDNPIAGAKNQYLFSDFPNVGRVIELLTQKIHATNSNINIHLNCGFTRCMFTNKQYAYLINSSVDIPGWGCFGKKSSMDVTTELDAFHCFPMSTRYRLKTKGQKIDKIEGKLVLNRFKYWKKIASKVCIECPFYGLGSGRCPGPCIAFKLNEKRSNESL